MAAVQQHRRVEQHESTLELQLDMMLLVSALRNFERGAIQFLGADHPAVATFGQQVPDSVPVRDMLEHFDDYVLGNGKLQGLSKGSGEWLLFFHGDGSDHAMQMIVRAGDGEPESTYVFWAGRSMREADVVLEAIDAKLESESGS
jgi:hypothetical protein